MTTYGNLALKVVPTPELAVPVSEPCPSADSWGRDPDPHQAHARRCLAQVASTGEWAQAVGVTERMIRLWIAGEKRIPPLRLRQVFAAHAEFCCRYRRLEEVTMQLLVERYGGQDAGRF